MDTPFLFDWQASGFVRSADEVKTGLLRRILLCLLEINRTRL